MSMIPTDEEIAAYEHEQLRMANAELAAQAEIGAILAARIAKLETALTEIQAMAVARKTPIRMPNGRMLDNYCRHALNPATRATP